MTKMQEGFVNINNVPTLITTFGRWITEKPEKGENEELIILIPANNGSTGFYRTFMKILHTKFHCPVWVVANSGHDIPPSNVGQIPKKPLNLKEQTEQKVAFFDKYVPENAKVHLIGHSVGCHMVLELLKNPKVERKVLKSYLLFPLIERLLEGKKGIALDKNQKFQPLLIFFMWLFYILPEIISVNLMKIFKIPEKDIPFFINCTNPKILRQVLLVARNELDEIKERDNDVIRKNLDKIRMLYEKGDGWLPATCFSDLKRDFPQIKAEEVDIKHAFYLKNSVEVAEITAKWIKE